MTNVTGRTGMLEPLLTRVTATCPSLADPFEATAVLESFGYTDRIIQEEFGQPDSRALGAIVYERQQDASSRAPGDGGRSRPGVPAAQSVRDGVGQSRFRESFRVFAQTCSLSLIYSMPWIAAFVLERYHPDLMQVPPESAAPLNVALMASLILSGGFVQCIARKGQFYNSLSQPRVGAAVCRRIWWVGLATATIAAVAGVAIGLYFELFQPRYLLLAALHFEALTLLWMTCAILWLDRTYWQVPAVFVAGAAAFWGSHSAGQPALVSTMASTVAAVAMALALMFFRAALRERRSNQKDVLAPPRYAVFLRSLTPYFCYGVGYFSFVFADRIAAGTSVSTSAGVQFAIDPGYKIGMDVSLLLFLMSMTAVEYINFDFMRFWQDEARRWTPTEGSHYRARLRRRYTWSRVTVTGVYAAVALLVWLLLGLPDAADGPLPRNVMMLGVAGYLLLELALFNALVLFSVNATVAVLKALAPALVINVCLGYVLSNTMGPLWAAVAMAAGAAVFLWQSQLKVREALARPGYCCYVS
jgi:hypothetical protein